MKKILLLFFALLACVFVQAQTDFDAGMRAAGLVDILEVDSTLRVKLMYATADNFVGENMYGNLKKAYVQPGFAQKVAKAQRLLRAKRPGWRILILDAARPMSVQRQMYSLVKDTPNRIYVADGSRGGCHNYGAAVDVTLLDERGRRVDMGTPVDHFGEAAHTGNEAALVAAGKISKTAAANRELLKRVMREAGLIPYYREWWHYTENISMTEVRRRYKLLDF